jgi:hypothetical protein
LTKLDHLDLLFNYRTPHSYPQPPSPDTCTVLPALTKFSFQGVCQYLEILLAQVDAPLLEQFKATYFDQLEFNFPRAIRFIGCYRGRPMPKYLRLTFCLARMVMIAFSRHDKGGMKFDDHSFCLEWKILRKEFYGQVFSVVDVCSQIVPVCSTVERLDIMYDDSIFGEQLADVGPTVFLDLFRSLTSVTTLALSIMLEPFIGAALAAVPEELVAEVFPTLEKIFVLGQSPMGPGIGLGMELFVAARQHVGRPVVVKEL